MVVVGWNFNIGKIANRKTSCKFRLKNHPIMNVFLQHIFIRAEIKVAWCGSLFWIWKGNLKCRIFIFILLPALQFLVGGKKSERIWKKSDKRHSSSDLGLFTLFCPSYVHGYLSANRSICLFFSFSVPTTTSMGLTTRDFLARPRAEERKNVCVECVHTR